MPNLLASRWGRLTAFFFLYVTEGIPLGFASVAIATQLRRQDVGPAEIGAFVGSFYLPWAFKWAFGPIIDVFFSEKLGRRRGWIIGTQVMLVLTLLACTGLNLPAQLGLLTSVLLIHNTFGAMQDVAIDALAVNTLAEDERGLANGVMFGGASIGTAIGGGGVLYLMPYIGVKGGFVFVAACIALVTIFIALPLKEKPTPESERREAGLASAGRAIVKFADETFRSFHGSRGAFAGVFFALLPAGAMSLGLALQSNVAVEIGMKDNEVASLSVASQVVAAVCMVVGGLLSDKLGRRRMLGLYLVLMSPPALYLAWKLQMHGWVMPNPAEGKPGHREISVVLISAMWVASLAYAVGQGLMYGTRTAAFMDVTNPRVAATQFTAYMAMMNLAISYSSTWQGIASEVFGYPMTLVIDAITGPLCVLLLPFMAPSKDARVSDDRAAGRARLLALVLGFGCICWVAYSLGAFGAGPARPMWETLFTLVSIASAVYLLAGAATRRAEGGALRVAGLSMAGLLALSYLMRKWQPQLGEVYAAIGLAAAVVLLLTARLSWQQLRPQAAPAAV